MIDGTAPGDVLCERFVTAQPVAEMRSIPIDRQGLRAAAEDIVRFESPHGVAIAFREGDPRLRPHLTAAIAQRKADRDGKRETEARA
jgi:hypothetical protein